MNPVGIYFAYWEREWYGDFAAYVKKVKRLGFDVLELGAGALAEMEERELRLIADTARDEGIGLTYCIGLPAEYNVASTDEGVRRAGIKYVGRLLDIIRLMGGDMLGGIIYACWPGRDMSMELKSRMREKSVSSMRELSKKAEDNGIDLCFEVVNRFEQCLLNTAQEGVDFAREVDSPRAKLLLDSFHMNIEEDGFGEAIHTAGRYLGHFHIGENNRRPPGQGRLPWKEIADALRETGYTGRVVMEPFIRPGGQVGEDIKIFRDISGGADDAQMDEMAARSAAFMKEILKN